jgi:uncharacterized C2H2 Zn-finger protein
MSNNEYYVLLTAPYGWNDIATDVTAPYYARLYPRYVVEPTGFKAIVLEKNDANPFKFWEVMRKYKGKIVMVDGVGHGGPYYPPQRYTGWNMSDLIVQPVEKGAFDGIAFKPISCLIGRYLVPEMAEKSSNFLGIAEVEEYWIVVEFITQHKGEYWGEDEHLESFLRVEFETAKMLLQGIRGEDSYSKMLELYEEEARKWEKVDPETAYWLRYDARYRKMYGNKDWVAPKPSPQPPPPPPPPPPQCKHVCPWCSAEFGELEQLKQHIVDVHEKDICEPCPECPECNYKCPWCDAEFKNANKLIEHILAGHLKPCKLSSLLRRKLACPLP